MTLVTPDGAKAGAAAAPTAVLGPVDEQGRVGSPPSILLREVFRQALLLAVRQELGLSTRDSSLGEEGAADSTASAGLQLVVHYSYQKFVDVSIREAAPSDRELWRERLNFSADDANDLVKSVDAAERWSREAWPQVLQRAGYPRQPATAEPATVSKKALGQLQQMTFLAQFAALRELYPVVRNDPSPASLGALVRGQANLGVQTEFLWTPAHKALKGRALLYAQRLAAQDAGSPWGLWHRAYAKAMSGLHQPALDDLAAAQELPIGEPKKGLAKPKWVDLIEAYCRFDTEKLAAGFLDGETKQLTGLLHYLAIEDPQTPSFVLATGRRALDDNPECFRVQDGLCNVPGIANWHWSTQIGWATLDATLASRLLDMPELPAAVQALLANTESVDEIKLMAALREAGAVVQDRSEISWRALAGLIQEHRFVQIWRRADFMRFRWSVPVAGFLQQTLPYLAGHRYAGFAALHGMQDGAAREALTPLMTGLNRADLDQNWALYELVRRYAPAEAEKLATPFWQHHDAVFQDLKQSLSRTTTSLKAFEAKRLKSVSPHSPHTLAASIGDTGVSAEQRLAWERQYGHSAVLMRALADYYRQQNQREDANRCLASYLKISPDYWAFQRLAADYKQAGQNDKWKETLSAVLEQEDVGLTHAQVRVEIANYHMERQEWQEAEPYAVAAAESYAKWAMICARNCYEGMGKAKEADEWFRRIVERYPGNELEYALFRQRHRLGDPKEDGLRLLPDLDGWAKRLAPNELFWVGTQYLLRGNERQALATFSKAFAEVKDERSRCYNGFFTAWLADRLGDNAARDKALRTISETKDAEWDIWRKLADLLQKSLAQDNLATLERGQIDRLLVDASSVNQINLSYFVGMFLLNHDQNDTGEHYLKRSANHPDGGYRQNHILAVQQLRDRGIDIDVKRD